MNNRYATDTFRFSRKLLLSLSAAALGRLYANPLQVQVMDRKIPSTQEKIPCIGMGTYQTFDVTDSKENTDRLKSVLDVFYNAGGRLIDSSPMYGSSEEIFGKIAAGRRYFYATKVWTSGKEKGIHQMNESFSKMKTGTMDLMQIHNLVDWKTHIKTLRKWKEEGKIRYIGITHYVPSSFGEMERIIKQEEIDFIQIPYSAVTRDAEKSILKTAGDTKTAVLVNRPFEGGEVFREIRQKKLPSVAVELKAVSWAQLLLKYILAHPDVTCAIPATGNPGHMKENMDAGSTPLPDEKQKKEILKALN